MSPSAVRETDLYTFFVDIQNRRHAFVTQTRHRLHPSQLFQPVEAGLQASNWTAPAMSAIIGFQAPAQDPHGDLLQGRSDSSAHRKTALVELILAVASGELAAHLLGEVISLDELGVRALAGQKGLGAGT